jgi:hypothetical protein
MSRLMMKAVRASETSVHFNVTTRRYIPEDSELHTRRHENLNPYKIKTLNVMVERLVLLLRIRGVPTLDLGPEISYTNRSFEVFLSHSVQTPVQ